MALLQLAPLYAGATFHLFVPPDFAPYQTSLMPLKEQFPFSLAHSVAADGRLDVLLVIGPTELELALDPRV